MDVPPDPASSSSAFGSRTSYSHEFYLYTCSAGQVSPVKRKTILVFKIYKFEDRGGKNADPTPTKATLFLPFLECVQIAKKSCIPKKLMA